jgi:hypothetical protein
MVKAAPGVVFFYIPSLPSRTVLHCLSIVPILFFCFAIKKVVLIAPCLYCNDGPLSLEEKSVVTTNFSDFSSVDLWS